MSTPIHEKKEKLLKILHTALQKDHAFREKYKMGEKFRFIRDRLQALATQIEESLSSLQQARKQASNEITEDETLIYVYLYNAHGNVLKTWQKMLTPTVFYEYSINRPIYIEKSAIEAFIRAKPNKLQSGYLTMIIKKQDIAKSISENLKDTMGNILIKVKEGSLHFDRFVSFTHNGYDYYLGEEGELVKK